MDRVGARLGRDADRGARRAPVFRRVRARDDLELLDCVHRRARDLRRQLLHVLGDAVVVDAVEQEVVLQRTGAVDVDAAGAAERRAAALLGVAVALHARHEREQVVPVPDGERQVGHLRVRDDGAERAVVGVQQRGGLLHGDDFVQRAHLEHRVDSRAGADFERHDLGALFEARQRGFDLIAARDQVHEEERPGRGRRLLGGDAGREVGQRDGRAWQHGAALVGDGAGECGAIDLRGRHSGQAEGQKSGQKDQSLH